MFLGLIGCGSGSGSNGGSGGSGGGGTSFQPRPFPGDYFASPPIPEFGGDFTGNVVYAPKLKAFFFSNPAMNEVEAYSTADGHRIGAVSVPGPMGLSLAPDGSELAVGSSTPRIFFVDPVALHVTGVVTVPASLLNWQGGLAPVLPFLMASGPMLIEASGAVFGDFGLVLSYDRSTGTFARAGPPGTDLGVYGPAPARSLDGKYLAVSTAGQTGLQLAVYSADSQSYIGMTPDQRDLTALAASPDGSQFVTAGTPSSDGTKYITFWSRDLQQQARYATDDSNIVYSRDGKYLYASEPLDVLALDTQTGKPAGYQGLSIAAMRIVICDVDESYHVLGMTDLGAFVASVAQLQPQAPAMPVFSEDDIGASIGNPNEGPLSGGTKVEFVSEPISVGNVAGLSSTYEAYFGSVPATKDEVANGNALIATAPPAGANGPVTVVLTDANNNTVLLPAAYSYGPHVHWVSPSAIPTAARIYSLLWADGILTVGPDTPAKVDINGLDASPRPMGIVGGDSWRMLAIYPPSNPSGWADLKMSLPDGTSETTKNMVQYLAQDVELTNLPVYISAVYDPKRDRFYLTGADNTIGVFDPQKQQMLQPLQSSSISPGAVLGSLAMTPDNAKLLASDPADASVVVFDLAGNTSSAVKVFSPSESAIAVRATMPVAALKGNKAFVLITPWIQDELREIDLTNMTVKIRGDLLPSEFSDVPSTLTSSADGSVALLGGATGGYSPPFFAWRYDTSSDSFSPAMGLLSAEGYGGAVNADGSVLVMGALSLDQALLPLVPLQLWDYRQRLTASGALRYTPSAVSDTRTGHLLLSFETGNSPTALAIDPHGKKVLSCSGTTLYYHEFSVVPLAVATVTPAQAAVGARLTLRGNGFVSGTSVTLGGQRASCSRVDDQTLQCSVPNLKPGLAPMTLSNPDGQSYQFEAAVTVE